jgi:hypothetical protein
MSVQTGADGQLKYNNRTVAKVRDWSLSVSKDALESTCLGEFDRSYVQGLRGTTGSATVLYDPTDSASREMLGSIFRNDETNSQVDFVLSQSGNREFSCSAFITSVSPSVSVGAATACSVSFQVTGKPSGGF